jgi:hypothetical protein
MVQWLTDAALRLPRRPAVFLAAGAMLAAMLGASPAQACPFGPRPVDPNQSWIAVCTGTGSGEDAVLLTKPDLSAPLSPFTLSATATYLSPNGTGYVTSEAGVAKASLGDAYLNPDLHAAAYGSVVRVGQTVGDADGQAEATFNDIITIEALPPGVTGGYFFTLEFDVEGILTSTPAGTNSAPSSEGWASAGFNLSISELGDEANFDADGVGWMTVSGDDGAQSKSILVGLFVELGHSYVLRGDLGVTATGRGDAEAAAVFGADFANSARFAGIRGYTDSSRTIELADVAVGSGFGFDYKLNLDSPSEVPEPGSLLLLASAAGLLGASRRRGGATG